MQVPLRLAVFLVMETLCKELYDIDYFDSEDASVS